MPGVFPALRTSALAQYPLWRAASFAADAIQFLDFSRQVYRDLRTAKARWTVSLENLDEAEVAILKGFFEQQRGQWGTFSFNDPWDGSVHSSCSFAQDKFPQKQIGEGRHQTTLTIYEHA
jgi:hypothetical protein